VSNPLEPCLPVHTMCVLLSRPKNAHVEITLRQLRYEVDRVVGRGELGAGELGAGRQIAGPQQPLVDAQIVDVQQRIKRERVGQ